MSRGLLVAGTTSDAGKSLLVAGLCRVLARRGVRVAPFKAQNMSNNSMVCPDGAEIGRAQWLQALAARAAPEAAMNPVLLKPGSDRRSHVVLLGRPWGELAAGEWASGRRELARAAFAAYDDLAARHDVVVAEGAGSAAEVNLRAGDYVNLGLARHAGLPVVVVGDIDRGGVLAAMYGTWALLDPADRAHLAGWIVNRFRGDVDLLRPGLDVVTDRTGLPVLGVVPWLDGVWLDGEDALTLGAWHPRPGAGGAGVGAAREAGTGAVGEAGGGPVTAAAGARLRVAVARLPRLSNATDIDALAAEPGVDVVVTADPTVLAAAHLAVLPGTRATLADLAWLRERGLGDVIAARAAAATPVLGICGGYQMLARRIADPEAVEATGPGAGADRAVDGLGLLPVDVRFAREKTLQTPKGSWRGHPVAAYAIHHGVARAYADTETPRVEAAADAGGEDAPFLDGWQRRGVWGTTWHGAFENDGFRRAFLAEVAARAGVRWRASPTPGFRARRETMLERVADAVEEHVDTSVVFALTGL